MLIGIVYLIGFSVGRRVGEGSGGFVVMAVFSTLAVVLGRRSETIKGLLDRRDERIAGIGLQATASTALAMIVAVLVGYVVDVANGGSGGPDDWIAAVGGLAYIAAVIWPRVRN
ncbi:MAG: hypothetical protein ACLQPH_15340 [Acidimicrobiales bacterium]